MSDDIEHQVDELIDARGGRELLHPVYDEVARPIVDGFIYQSAGTSASYMVVTDVGRIIVNTGMGFEAHHHKTLFDAVCPGPTTHIFSTQAHVDHLSGVAVFREPGAVYFAQANNLACQADDARIQRLRMSTAMIWFGNLPADIGALLAKYPGAPIDQDRPTPDLTFTDRMALKVGSLDIELIAAVGETIDSMIVWFPQHQTAMISNLLGPLFPHFPNIHTLRGDKYRYVEPYLASIRKLRELGIERLVVGRGGAIEGSELIDASLRRLHDAVEYVHRETLAGINAGMSITDLMREIQLPEHLRVGQGYGKVSWAVRTIWESYVGWFRLQSTTELYPDEPVRAIAELVAVAGVDAVLTRARDLLSAREPVRAIQLLEGVVEHDAEAHAAVAPIMCEAHEQLLADGGDMSFWEHGWLVDQIGKWSK